MSNAIRERVNQMEGHTMCEFHECVMGHTPRISMCCQVAFDRSRVALECINSTLPAKNCLNLSRPRTSSTEDT